MIQRKQTIWLLLAAVAGFLTTQVPLFSGSIAGESVKKYTATESLLIFAVAIIAALIAFITIFLFKNRATQLRLSFLGILLSIALIALEVWEIEEFGRVNALLKGTYDWGSLLPIAMMIFFFLAVFGIRKDEKLVKSLDRLR